MTKAYDQEQAFQKLYNEARQAGLASGNAITPIPMNVVGSDGERYHVSEGMCGFAWVWMPATTPFARWLRAKGYACKGYPNGIQVSILDYNQSIARKEAHAHAMARVFREAGYVAYAQSRLD